MLHVSLLRGKSQESWDSVCLVYCYSQLQEQRGAQSRCSMKTSLRQAGRRRGRRREGYPALTNLSQKSSSCCYFLDKKKSRVAGELPTSFASQTRHVCHLWSLATGTQESKWPGWVPALPLTRGSSKQSRVSVWRWGKEAQYLPSVGTPCRPLLS